MSRLAERFHLYLRLIRFERPIGTLLLLWPTWWGLWLARPTGEAKYMSSPNSVRPIEPKGTRPISTRLPDMRSHNSEPRPMPTVKVASSSVTDDSPPPSTFLA